jgi:hypothetical protein
VASHQIELLQQKRLKFYREATFKIIPCQHESDSIVKLVWLNEEGNGVRQFEGKQDLTVKLIRNNLSYPVFNDHTEANHDNFRNYINSRNSGEKFHCNVTNHTSNMVFVLDDAYADGCYYYSNTVWLPQDSCMVGAHGLGIRACFRFGIYKVKDAPSDKAAFRTRVQELFGQVPNTGRLGLRNDGAELVKYVWLRVKVPSLGKNSISVAELGVDDVKKDIVDLKTPIALSNLLDGFKGYTNEEKWFDWTVMKAQVKVDGGHSPGSYCNLFTK